MTISSAMNAGVAGLNANATRISTISDNIANSATYGYKRASADFSSLVLASGRGAGSYTAGGVTVSTFRQIDESGGIVGTANALDLAVTGRGMIPVMPAGQAAAGVTDGSLLLTTTGSFDMDEAGRVVTATGLVLLGWPVASDGTVSARSRDTITGLQPVIVNPAQTRADPTTEIALNLNLPATATTAGSPASPYPVTVEYYTNTGTAETVTMTFTPNPGAAGMSNQWTLVITDSASGGAVIGEFDLEFDDTRAAGGTLAAVTDVSGGTYDAITGELSLTLPGGPLAVSIGALGERGGITQLSDSFAPGTTTRNGSPPGMLTTLSVDERGFVVGTYSTGHVQRLYQIPLVDVPNVNGLEAGSDQTYRITRDSGPYYLWDAGDGPTGRIQGYSRESSATDLAAELTALIQTQRAYSSNAKIIQTVDEMMQETTNLKR